MIKVEFNKSNNNPFEGLKNCLSIQQASSSTITFNMLDKAWEEVKNDSQKREMFFSLLFSIGDVANRQHNIFKGKIKDNGGNSNRESFETIILWIFLNHREQFIKFLHAGLFNEYSCFDLLFKNRVQTTAGTSKIRCVHSVFENEEYQDVLLEYVYSVVNGNNPFNKMLVAKFLTIPRLSKRQNHNRMLPETHKIMEAKADFICKLSELMGWETRFLKGYREWRKQYNGELESVLFSTGKIKDFNKEEFTEWLDKLPALARARVRSRVFTSKDKEENLKYPTQKKWFQEWELNKEKLQAEQRALEEKIRQGQATDEDKLKLKKVQKEAKVSVGANNFKEIYNSICNGRVDKLKLETFMNKVHLDYNTLVIIDDSGSMDGKPFNFASFLASVCLVKNPDDDVRNLLGFFARNSHWHGFIDSTVKKSQNSIMRTKVAQTNAQPLVDPLLSFYDNYVRISKFCKSVFRGGGTYLNSVIRDLKPLVKENPDLLDTLKSYPVWTLVSDGDINSSYNAKASIQEFFDDCQEAFGFTPYLVLIDVGNEAYFHPEKFEGLDNFMYIPGNINLIEQFLTNFKDMDRMDVYTSLQSIYRSNRYELVREHTL